DTVLRSSVTVTAVPETATVSTPSPAAGLTVAPGRKVPMAGLTLSTALTEPAVSSVYIPVTTVVPPTGTMVRLSVGAPSGVASVPLGQEISPTPNTNRAMRGTNFK